MGWFGWKKKGEKIADETKAALAAAEDAIKKAKKIEDLQSTMEKLNERKRNLIQIAQEILIHQTNIMSAKNDLTKMAIGLAQLMEERPGMSARLLGRRAARIKKKAEKIKIEKEAAEAELKKFEDDRIRLAHIQKQQNQIDAMTTRILAKMNEMMESISDEMTGQMQGVLDSLERIS